MSVGAWIWRVFAVLALMVASAGHAIAAALAIAVLWGASEFLLGASRRSRPEPAQELEPALEAADPGAGPLASLKAMLVALGREASRLEAGSPELPGRLERLENE